MMDQVVANIDFERLTLSAAAKLIDPTGESVTARTLYNASRSGFLAVQRIGKQVMVSKEDLSAFLSSRTQFPARQDTYDFSRVKSVQLSRGVQIEPGTTLPSASPVAAKLKRLKSRETRFNQVKESGPVRGYR